MAVEQPWADSGRYETPKAYGNRVYTRRHWTRFFINYNGKDRYLDDALYVGALHACVFDLSTDQKMREGLTAVRYSSFPLNDFSSAVNSTPDKPDQVRDLLEGFGIPKDSGYYLVSPGYLAGQPPFTNGLYSVERRWPLSVGSGALYDVPVREVSGSWDVPGNATLANPVKVSSRPADTAGAWKSTLAGTKKVFWRGYGNVMHVGTVGVVDLTKNAAIALYGADYTTRADIIVSFPYNLTLLAEDEGGGVYRWSVINWSPLQVERAHLRVYLKGKSGKWYKVPGDSDAGFYTSVGPFHPRAVQVSGLASGDDVWKYHIATDRYRLPSMQLPPEAFDVVFTLNLRLDIDSNGRLIGAAEEPVVGKYKFGSAAGKLPPGMTANGLKERAQAYDKASQVLGRSVPAGYGDNVYNVAGMPGGRPDFAVTELTAVPAGATAPLAGGEALDPNTEVNFTVKFAQLNPNATPNRAVVRVVAGLIDGGALEVIHLVSGDRAEVGPDGVTYTGSFKVPGGDPREIEFFASINGDHVVEEDNYDNNRKAIRFRVAELLKGNLRVLTFTTGADETKTPPQGKEGTQYTAQASFQSSFDVRGRAWVRLYYRPKGAPMQLLKESYEWFEPGGIVSISAPWTMPANSVELYAAVAAHWDGSKWVNEPFTAADGKAMYEVKYDDNLAQQSVVGEMVYTQTSQTYRKRKLVTQMVEVTTIEWVPGGYWVSVVSDVPRDVERTQWLVK